MPPHGELRASRRGGEEREATLRFQAGEEPLNRGGSGKGPLDRARWSEDRGEVR